MITTITAATVTAATADSVGFFALIMAFLLLTLLLLKEIVGATDGVAWLPISRALSIVIVPLGLVFLIVVVASVMRVL